MRHLRIDDRVEILIGEYEGRTGRVTAIGPDVSVLMDGGARTVVNPSAVYSLTYRDQMETVSQMIHGYRHPANMNKCCDDCRREAKRIASVLL